MWLEPFKAPSVLLAAALLLAACGPIPQPYREGRAEKAANPLIDVPDAAGVVVAPVTGAPPALSGPLTEALVAELQQAGIPASSGAALTHGLLLEGDAGWTAGKTEIAWRLSDAEGADLGAVTARVDAPRAAYETGDPVLIQSLARRGAMLLTGLLKPDMAYDALAARTPAVAVIGVEGAPGNGNAALAKAMRAVLDQSGIPRTDDQDEAALLLAAGVSVEAGDTPNTERVTIDWWLMDSTGAVLGTLNQSNLVPKGALDGRWGTTAYDAAYANVEAVQEMLTYMDEVRDLQRNATENR